MVDPTRTTGPCRGRRPARAFSTPTEEERDDVGTRSCPRGDRAPRVAGRPRGGDAALALARGHAAHGAHRRRRRDRGVRARRLRRRRQQADVEQARRAARPPAASSASRSSSKFTFVNHVTTNPFFVPTQYGAEDACKLLGCSYQWTGSESANVNEMVNAFNSAISAKADGIAVCLVDLKAFNGPTDEGARRPASRSSATTPTRRQRAARLHRPGPVRVRRRRWASGSSTSSPSGDVALFIATPGSLEHPAADRRRDRRDQEVRQVDHARTTIATGAALPKELSAIDAYWLGHKDTKGMFAVDAGSTQGRRPDDPEVQAARQGRQGRRLRPATADHAKLLAADQIDFTIDQQPYLQGFLPVLRAVHVQGVARR